MPECMYEEKPGSFSVVRATPQDSRILLQFESKLAAHEDSAAKLCMNEAMLMAALLHGWLEGLLLKSGDKVIGHALFYQNFATFPGRPGMFLESLYVDEQYRGTGGAHLLFDTLRTIAEQRGYARIDWIVLAGNTIAQNFYHKKGGSPKQEWNLWRIELGGEQVQEGLLVRSHALPAFYSDAQFREDQALMLRKYLLGRTDLRNGAREALHEVSVLAQQMQRIEIALFEEYVADQLSETDRNNFEGIYLTNETNPQKYRFKAWCRQKGLGDKYFPKACF